MGIETNIIRMLSQMPKDDKQAVTWFHKVAEQGDAEAQFQLGSIHEHGRGWRRHGLASMLSSTHRLVRITPIMFNREF